MQTSGQNPEQILRRLDWHVIRRLDGILQGDYRSLFYGFGVDFADLREYQPSDDIRYIDWNVTARTTTPYVRQYHEDRELSAWFLLDLSPSLNFGTTNQQKRNMLIDFVSTMARLLTRQGNRVGSLLYGDQVDLAIPAMGGRNQVLRIIKELLERPLHSSSAITKLSPLFLQAAHSIKRRSLIFVVSDFISDDAWGDTLHLLSQRHEVIAVRLWDPLEVELPDIGWLVLEDSETGEQLFVDTHDRAFRERYHAAALVREAEFLEQCKRANVAVMSLASNDDLVKTLIRFAQLRKRQGKQ